VRYWNGFSTTRIYKKLSDLMFKVRILATAVACALAVPAFAQEPVQAPNTGEVAAVAPDGSAEAQAVTASASAVPQLPRVTPIPQTSFFRLSAGDFKNFFSADTARTLAYTSIVAIGSAPWDREGINNGFNIPTTVFQSGNVIGSFAFQVGAGAATYGIAKVVHNQKAAEVGRDIVRAQILSQVMVQTLKFTVQRERPDGSNSQSFPSGHSSSAFATAAVLHRHYGWKVGAPAYALGSYVALARMSWNRHHATDVVMGAGIGIAAARTVTMTVAKSKFNIGMQPQVGGASVNFTKIYK
jgi:membrane-associated phospholipid phosphatase